MGTRFPVPDRVGWGRYRAIVIGLLLVIGGVGALGIFLVAAGQRSSSWLFLGAACAVLLASGIALIRASARRRGGFMSATVTPRERRTYRRMYRGLRPRAH